MFGSTVFVDYEADFFGSTVFVDYEADSFGSTVFVDYEADCLVVQSLLIMRLIF